MLMRYNFNFTFLYVNQRFDLTSIPSENANIFIILLQAFNQVCLQCGGARARNKRTVFNIEIIIVKIFISQFIFPC